MRPAQLAPLALPLLLAACGGVATDGEAADHAASGLTVSVEGEVPSYAPAYLSSGDLSARARTVAAAAAGAWHAPPGALDGYRIVFALHPFDCGRKGSEAGRIVGCTWESERLVQVLGLGSACPEATVLAHEVGHAVLGDNAHQDPRWRDRRFWEDMRAVMAQSAPPDCTLDRFVEFNRVGDD